MSETRSAWGFAACTTDADGVVLDAWFPAPSLGGRPAQPQPPADLAALAGYDDVRRVTTDVRLVEAIDLTSPPSDTLDVWLRLHLLSHRLIRPHDANLDGDVVLLTNQLWTSTAACPVEYF
jgi:2,3,4,5-tetrahydropyridine-2-carboxylate N-succinyltransferase